MAKTSFMSMRWLRLHIKEIIWSTVILFVLSCFIIGFGTSSLQKRIDEKQKQAEAAEAKAEASANMIPANIRAILNLPAIHISYSNGTSSATRVLDGKTVYNTLLSVDEYQRLLNGPANLKEAFGDNIKDNIINSLIDQSLLGLYADLNNIKPIHDAASILAEDRKKLSPAEFARALKREGITEEEYVSNRQKGDIIQQVVNKVTQPIASGVTETFVKGFYEKHKIRYKKDDEISLKHLLISSGDFAGKVEISDDQISRYFDEHRSDFMSSQLVSVRHLFVNPQDEAYLNNIPLEESAIRKYYSQNIDQFKKPEEVKASHILIKPKTTFEKSLDTFTISIRNFALKETTGLAPSDEGQYLYTFDMGVFDPKTGLKLLYEDITLITNDDQKWHPTEESMAGLSDPLKIPLSGAPNSSITGKVGILFPKTLSPTRLEISDSGSVQSFEVKNSHDEEKAFDEAKAQAQNILEKINEGDDFNKLAGEFSDDTGSKASGGDLGFFPRGQMVKPFEEAAFSAKENEVKGPIRTQFGYHLIKVVEKHAARILSIDDKDVREKITFKIKSGLAAEKAESDILGWRELLEQKTKSFDELARAHSMALSKKDGGRLPAFFKGEISDEYPPEKRKLLNDEIGDNGKIEESLEEVIFSLKEPFEMTECFKSSKGFHLFQLENILPPVQLSLTNSLKGQIRDILDEEKRKEMASQKASQISSEINSTNFTEVAEKVHPDGATSIGPVPFSAESNFKNYALTKVVGQLSVNGRSYIPAIQSAIAGILQSPEQTTLEKKLLGPIKTELGFHFILLEDAVTNQYESFDSVKEKLRELILQEPSEKEIIEEFEQKKEKLDKPPTRKFRQIVVDTEELANKIYQQLQNGEIFGLLAKKYSVDGSAQNNGYIGDVKKGSLPEIVEKVIWDKDFKKGQFSKPIKTNYGYLLFQLDGAETPEKPAELKDYKDQIKVSLRNKLKKEFFEGFLTELRATAKIVLHPEVIKEL